MPYQLDGSTLDSPASMPLSASLRRLAPLLVVFLPLIAPAGVNADLSLVSNDAIFGTNIDLEGSTVVNGNVGVGPSGKLYNNGGGATVTGNVVLGSGATVSGITVGGTTSNADLSQAIAGIKSTSSMYAALVANTMAVIGGNGNPNNISISSTTSGGVNVANLASLSPQGGGKLTLSGVASDYFIINVGSVSFSGGGTPIVLNGVQASHVLFNVTGGSQVTLNGTLYGTFLVPNAAVTFNGGATLNGSVLDGSTVTMGVDAQANTHINGTGNLFISPVTAPEPATIGLAISGVAAIGLSRLFRRKRPG